MSDLIRREDVVKAMNEALAVGDISRVIANDILNNIPSAEPERKKGKWIEQDDGWDGIYYECSECREAFTLMDGTPTDNLYNFCPHCGADMRGE